MKPETTSQQVDEYVRERLRKEVAEGPRGTAARIAERLDIAPAHLSVLAVVGRVLQSSK